MVKKVGGNEKRATLKSLIQHSCRPMYILCARKILKTLSRFEVTRLKNAPVDARRTLSVVLRAPRLKRPVQIAEECFDSFRGILS